MIFEVCTDNLEGVLLAEKLGVKRIELCSSLSVGGLTPSFGLIKQCVDKSNIEIHVMIRPLEGGFNYSSEEVSLMLVDIDAAKRAGAHGVVFGVLTNMNEVSLFNKELVENSKSMGLEVTFHRAFDFVSNYKKAIETIIEYGFDRLLTSGLKPTAIEGLEVISDLQANYGKRIQVMAGSGINAKNVLKIASVGVNNIHFTARKSIDEPSSFEMGELMVVDTDKISSIINLF